MKIKDTDIMDAKRRGGFHGKVVEEKTNPPAKKKSAASTFYEKQIRALEAVVSSLQKTQESNRQILKTIVQELNAIKSGGDNGKPIEVNVDIPKPQEWDFEILRDSNGRMTGVKARGK